MNKRTFIKILSSVPFLSWLVPISASPVPLKKRYITECKHNQFVGVRFEWKTEYPYSNPVPGSDWEITALAPNPLNWRGEWLSNDRGNKWMAVAIEDRSKMELLCFFPSGNTQINLPSLANFYVLE